MKTAANRYKVNVGRRNRYFGTLEEASRFCSEVFRRTGIVLSIVATR